MKPIVIVNNVESIITSLEKASREKFFEINGFHKTKEMCDVNYCSNKAEFIWSMPFLLKIKRIFTGEGNWKGCRYCKKCLRSACYRLNTPRKYWKEIK